MRIALIGAGRIGQAHAATLRASGRVEELLVADLDAARARAVQEEVDIARAVSIDDAFDTRPDGVVIAAPTTLHAEFILRAARAGIPTFCEKPLAPSLAETAAVVAAVEETATPVQIGFQRRFDAGYRAAREALATGKVGELRRVHMLTADPEPPPRSFIPDSGGIYRDCHIHDFDILRWVTAREVDSVMAVGANRGDPIFAESGDVDESVAILSLDDATLVTMHGSRYNGAGYDVRMELAGTDATYAVGLDDRLPLTSAEPGVAFPAGAPWRNFQQRFAAAYQEELLAFLAVVRGDSESPCTPRDAGEALYIAEAADRSRRERRMVRVEEVRTP